MNLPRKWSTLELAALAVAVVAITAMVVAIARSIREPENSQCLSVDTSVTDQIIGRSVIGGLTPLASVAVEDRWIRSRVSVPYEHYYVVAIRFRTTEGFIREGLWGLGVNWNVQNNGSIAIVHPADDQNFSISHIDRVAQDSTEWTPIDMPFSDGGESARAARDCLVEIGNQ